MWQDAGMLNQGSARDPKCKLNISSFLTLPHLLLQRMLCSLYCCYK